MTALGPAQAVAVGGAASFSDPATGDPAFVVQPTAGRYLGFDATCPHQGCPVQFAGKRFECPCHGAQFDTATGEVLRGPATSPLRKITVKEAGGTLYAK
jgi:thiosulfate dehydrogenase [quinone] large subunit